MGRKYLKNEVKDLGEFIEFSNGFCEFKCKICKQSLSIKNISLIANHVKQHFSEHISEHVDPISELNELSCSKTFSTKKCTPCEIDTRTGVSSIAYVTKKEESEFKSEIKSPLENETIKNYEECMGPEIMGYGECMKSEIVKNLICTQSKDKNGTMSKNHGYNTQIFYDKSTYLCDYNGKSVEKINLADKHEKSCNKSSIEAAGHNKLSSHLIQNVVNNPKNDLEDNLSNSDSRDVKNIVSDSMHVDSMCFSKPIMQYNEKLNKNDESNLKCKTKAVEIGDNNTFTCGKCNVKYKKFANLVRHQKICQGKSKNILKQASVKLKEKNENGMYQCPNCELEFSKLDEIESHEKLHIVRTNKNKIQCEICGKYLSTGAGLDLHLMRHTGRSPFKCLVCNRGFYNKYTLASHQQIHNSKKEYKCEHCNKEYSRCVDLKRHIRYSHLKEKPNSVMCDLCGKSFSFTFNLKYHMRRHLNLKPVKCDKCSMTFVERGDLNKHLITHNPDYKPFVCEICSKSFSRKITLTKHQKLHTGLKEYVCKICGKAFAQSPGLYMHMKTHGFNIKPEGAGYYERQSHLLFRNMNSDRASFT
ncbi:zinc finger protein 235-like [Condylostylus longicornis]|uniref:zinc finger protein 235-like n=1 Tax=Condylostylus longicornis TaxID=2530218 RepID=UPI00244DA04D|nr:zinc finger protein 235-like [Condylostylus longicornis]